MKANKIITQYLTDVSNIHSVSSYVEVYKEILKNIDLIIENEFIEDQLSHYCGSLKSAIERILEYLKTHNVNSKHYFVLAKEINILLSQFEKIMIEKGFEVKESSEEEKVISMYQRIALKLNAEKQYLPHAYELEKEFKEYIKIEDIEQKELEAKSNAKRNEIDKEIFDLTLQFATGKLDSYFKINSDKTTYTNNKLSAPKIAKEIKKESLEKYILCTLNYHNSTKNLWKSKKYLNAVYDYSIKNKEITLTYFFKEKHNQINQD
ncbi:hypothetical protein GCM10022386_21900 [Flavobacterium cheonhonense]|uniref:Uncharacterized protein n=1 Tax=Flavobacterium cheonhonense TaxID=706185 RepID=A0ABP7U4L7_9FLAO|nr:hypothetical protein [Flavobacterium cheonhonense]